MGTLLLNTRPEVQSLTHVVEPINRLVTALGATSKRIEFSIPTTSGEVFHGNGTLTRIPRGEVETIFKPRLGTINQVEIEPPVPATVPMRTVRVPKGVGVILTIEWGLFCTEQIGQELAPLIDNYSDAILRLTLKQDLDLADETATMIQVDPQASAQRLRAACMTKTARGTARRTTRIRAFSRR